MTRLRTGNISDQEYLKDYPEAETNVDRAKAMAIRSKASEVQVGHLANLASFAAEGDVRGVLDYQRINREELPITVRGRQTVETSRQYMDEARAARNNADVEALQGAIDYDRIKPTLDMAADLKSGRSGNEAPRLVGSEAAA